MWFLDLKLLKFGVEYKFQQNVLVLSVFEVELLEYQLKLLPLNHGRF